MKKYLLHCFVFFLIASWGVDATPISLETQLLSSTESDPVALIDHRVNVMSGDYREMLTDLIVKGPDDLIMQRYYSNSNYVTEKGGDVWRFFPQCWLTVGKGSTGKSCSISGTKYDWVYAFAGERSGSILTYSGWKKH